MRKQPTWLERADVLARTRAAFYVRMSTEHQRYSIAHQELALTAYADAHGLSVLRKYVDRGRSGLDLKNRPGLMRLLEDVQRRHCPFGVVLIYDVSRWGRFQDVDEGAYYEQLCRRQGIDVIYCEEPFVNDGGSLSALIKSIKRLMAAEYSRELGEKVSRAQKNLAARGFYQGGPANYGLRRVVVDPGGAVKMVMERGDQKCLQGDHVLLIPGPPKERAIIRWIYRAFLTNGLNEGQITAELIRRKVPAPTAIGWRPHQVHAVLTNERYIGNLVYNKSSGRLLTTNTPNDPSEWIRTEKAFEPVITDAQFRDAAQIFAMRRCGMSDAKMLNLLRELAARKGQLRAPIINREPGMPKSWVYANRFGSLLNAYERAGLHACRNFDFMRINRSRYDLRGELVRQVVQAIETRGGHVRAHMGHNHLTVDKAWMLGIKIVAAYRLHSAQLRWRVQFNLDLPVDVCLVICLGYHSHAPAAYFVLPRQRFAPGHQIRLGEINDPETERHRLSSLDGLTQRALDVIAENAATPQGLLCQRTIGRQP